MSRIAERAAFVWIALSVLALGMSPGPVAGAFLGLEPDLIYLGSFSGENASNSDERTGSSELRIESPVDWKLEVQMTESVHRVSDALELPLARLREIFPGVPDEIINGDSYVASRGEGSKDPRTIQIDWKILSDGLQSYLRPGDPPGEFETTLTARLLEADGDGLLAGPTTLVIEFRIQHWLGFPDGIRDMEIRVEGGDHGGVGLPTIIALEGNCGWTLSVSGEGDLVREDGRASIPLESISISVPDGEGYGDWTGLLGGWTPLQTEAFDVARGDDPPPFVAGEAGLPLLMRFDSDTPPSAGLYRTTLSFYLVTGSLSEN